MPNTYWVLTMRPLQVVDSLKLVSQFDSNYKIGADTRDQRRRRIPTEKTRAQAAASAANLARYDSAIAALQSREDQRKAEWDADPDNRRLAHAHQHVKTQRVKLQSERARVATRATQLDDELARVAEVADANTADEAKQRLGARFSLSGLKVIFETAEGDPEPPAGPAVERLGDDADARAWLSDPVRAAEWNAPDLPVGP